MLLVILDKLKVITLFSEFISKFIPICISDDMVEHENETMRDRVADLEKRVHDQSDEITCLRATLADALRRINELEDGKSKIVLKY